MIEIPEAITITNQVNSSIRGKKIERVVADHSPHKFAWYCGDPQRYPELLEGKTIEYAAPHGGMVSIKTDSATVLIGDGVALRYYENAEKVSEKHQLLLEFEDSSAITASIRMYGGIWCFSDGDGFDNPYYIISKEKPSPLSEDFSKEYFDMLISSQDIKKLSAKAFLATEQRIPGLGNGVLQDILWNAKIHPRCRMSTLNDGDIEVLYNTIKSVLLEMTEKGGRDTEKDLFGNNGGYKTVMSKNNAGCKCTKCEGIIKKENYLGGSIYFCESCQII